MAHEQPQPVDSTAKDPADTAEWDAFKDLAQRLVNVPKRELDKKRDAAKNGNGS